MKNNQFKYNYKAVILASLMMPFIATFFWAIVMFIINGRIISYFALLWVFLTVFLVVLFYSGPIVSILVWSLSRYIQKQSLLYFSATIIGALISFASFYMPAFISQRTGEQPQYLINIVLSLYFILLGGIQPFLAIYINKKYFN